MSDQVFTHQRSKNFGKVPAEVMHDKTLTDGAVRLYAHMHWRGGKILESFEGLVSMADYLAVNEKTIRNRVKELEARDWVMVVMRDPDPKTNVFKTHIYHIFEYQVDCRLFRKEYKPAAAETVRLKSAVEERKPRKGAGGNPKLRATSTQEIASTGTQTPSTPTGTQVPEATGTQVPEGLPDTLRNSSSNYPYADSEVFIPEKDSTAPSNAAVEQASSSLRSELPSNDSTGDSPVGEKQDVFEEFVDTLDLDDDLITIEEWEQLHGNDDKQQLYTCTAKDIAEMIAAWWEWVPVRPSVRGKPTTLSTQISIPTNREFAQNLFERGVRPIDFVRVLFPLRQKMAQGEVIKAMPFQYVCPMVDQFVAETWRDEMTSYSKEEPRYAPKKPNGKGVRFGENLWERDDLFVDVPPRYISIQDMDDEPEEIIASQPSEYENWTAEDWAKNGDPL